MRQCECVWDGLVVSGRQWLCSASAIGPRDLFGTAYRSVSQCQTHRLSRLTSSGTTTAHLATTATSRSVPMATWKIHNHHILTGEDQLISYVHSGMWVTASAGLRPLTTSATLSSPVTAMVASPSLFTLLLLLSLLLLSSARAAKLLGCFKDVMPTQTVPPKGERDLGALLFLQEDLTIEFCETQCGQRGYPYFGLQFGSECWCGSSYNKYGEAEGRCTRPCGGNKNEMCGGDLVNSVYEVNADKKLTPPPVDPTTQPLLALVMIVKDEAHTLPSTLISLAPYLDYYYILDTGSTDGTQQVIKQVLGSRGEVWEEPFIDYGRSRNRVLDIAQESSNPPVFVLMLSADETVYNAYSLRQFCEQHRQSTGEAHEAYPVVMDVGWKFDSLRLSRTDKGWRYVGRVHEYLAAPDQKWHPSLRVPDTYIKFRVTDPVRRSNREYTILKILLQEKDEKPTDTRTSFYLARTYNVIGNHSAALDEFRRRVELGGWQEEVYQSLYLIAWLLDELGRPWAEQEQAFLEAYEHSPERAEPLYAIAEHYYHEKMLPLAYLYASHAATLPYPDHAILWVEAPVYEWQCHHLVGMSAHRLGPSRYAEGYLALKRALGRKGPDEAMQRQLNRYKLRLGEAEVRRLDNDTQPAEVLQQLSGIEVVLTKERFSVFCFWVVVALLLVLSNDAWIRHRKVVRKPWLDKVA